MKKKRGDSHKRRNAALKSKRKAARETLADARARYRHGHREWPMVLVRAMVDNATKFKGEMPFSVRAAIAASRVGASDAVWNKLRAQGKAGKDQDPQQWLAARDDLIKRFKTDPPESHWQKLLRDFERAVLAGDDKWFERQAKAIRFNDTRSDSEKARARFEVAVLREYEDATDVAPQDMPNYILDRLEQSEESRYQVRAPRPGEKYGGIDQTKKRKGLIVEGSRFSGGNRCREAIKRIIERQEKE
jgi:hypothetical protein